MLHGLSQRGQKPKQRNSNMGSLERVTVNLGEVNLSYSIKNPINPDITFVSDKIYQPLILENARFLARLYALKVFNKTPPLFLGSNFTEKMITHQAKALINNSCVHMVDAIEGYYKDLSVRIDGY